VAVTPTDFWYLQAKDAITGVIALGGLTIALTNLYNAYLRRPRIVSTPASSISLASHYGEDAKLRIFVKCLFYNKGSEPALIISLKLKLAPTAARSSKDIIFDWHEFVSREEVKDAGTMHHKGIRAAFEGQAFALVIPKTDAVEKEIVFVPGQQSTPLTPGEYTLSLQGAFIGHGKRLRTFRSWSTRLNFTSKDFELVRERVVRDAAGHYLYSNHVQVESIPEVTA
jgi:hypothetical protein